MSTDIALCCLSDIPEGSARGFDPFDEGRDSVFVVRQGSQVFAYLDICPHYGSTSLPWRKDEYLATTNDAIVCAAHGAYFSIETGLCTSGPCVGESLTKVPVTITDSEDILVSLSS